MRPAAEPAITAADDPREFAATLHAMYDAAMSGGKMPAHPRSVISESWARATVAGVDPEHGAGDDPLGFADVERRRTESGLAGCLDSIVASLRPVVTDSDNLIIVADASGHVLWRAGGSRALRRADQLKFTEGASWSERQVGTNAIGTALASRHPVQVFSAEHFVRSHHAWTCTASPIRDPRTGELLGVVDVSGPAPSIHPTTLALVDSVAKLTESRLRDEHRSQLDLLRSIAAPIVGRVTQPAVAIDHQGWVAAVHQMPTVARIAVPNLLSAGRMHVGALGLCDVEPLPGGWLVRATDPSSSPVETTLTVTTEPDGTPSIRVDSGGGAWTFRPSPRHLEIIGLLAEHPAGLTAAQLSDKLFGSPDRTVTVRAEMSRLRRHLRGVLASSPYRFGESVRVQPT
ncbi:helix-turn-helix domain-containing protein [Gordonia sp. (in: high G+C Gram-positive bacteria)]|uniref:helix-turn-helix domain-containing protein n=1 Tax=Gordonia sp. (in: high G+C Gram-positive bacteria) TaxID=84139 RepID=UPI0016B7AA50|nr:helix-turn-helix domain-containing protein [Gordonia sp. (in: high G+C Gram-positive bacteria)]NLG45452.1 GAF domain-containing protein [Gordonia sp. (in: high G+C Gram-positive bacteria)]